MGLQELIRYVQLIRRRWKPIVGTFLGAMVTLSIVYFVSPQVYVAWAQLQVISPPPGAVTLFGGYSSGRFRDEIAYTQNTFVELLQGGVVARRTVEATGSDLSPEELQERTEVEVESDFILLTVAGDTADEAAQLANGLTDQALAYYGELLAQSSGTSAEFIGAQLELARQELDRAQTALMQFKIENKIGALDEDIAQQTSLIRSLERARDDAMVSNAITKANAYEVLIAEREQELQAVLNLSAQYQALETAVSQASGMYDYLLGKEAEAKITENQNRNPSFILVVEPAAPPRRSTSSFSKSILALGGVLSLALGIAIAFTWEYIETGSAGQEKMQVDSPRRQQPVHIN